MLKRHFQNKHLGNSRARKEQTALNVEVQAEEQSRVEVLTKKETVECEKEEKIEIKEDMKPLKD